MDKQRVMLESWDGYEKYMQDKKTRKSSKDGQYSTQTIS